MTATLIAYSAYRDEWLDLAKQLRLTLDREFDLASLKNDIRRVTTESGPNSMIAGTIATAFDKDVVFFDANDLRGLSFSRPVLAWRTDGKPFLITGRTFRRQYRIMEIVAGELTERTIRRKELQRQFAQGAMFSDKVVLDVWETELQTGKSGGWFWGSVVPLRRAAKYLFVAALVGNILAVCVSLFALQVWDRVIPASSVNTLSVLMIGVFAAILFELVLRLQRASLVDDVGIEIDKAISSQVFRQMLALQPDVRPQSMGALAAQLREINQIREVLSSSMVSAAIDVPFAAVFVLVIYAIAPQLIWPILGVIVCVIVICLIAQVPLSKLAVAGLEEASVRNGLIVESVMKADDLKLQQAETTVQLRWDKVIAAANTIGNKQRRWRNFLTNVTQTLQQAGYIMVVSLGAVLVIVGDLTMGQVIACSILTNRAIAPMAQVTAVMGALQGSRMAKKSIDALMELPNDLPSASHLRRELPAPEIALNNLRYVYPQTEHGALVVPRLEIPFGSKIGVLGRIGSGKSTLLKVLSGLARPTQGVISIGGADMGALHPSDLRKTIGFQSQSAALLRGTVRDNLLIAKPAATEAEMIDACKITGAANLVINNPRGLDLMINEAGEGLSGGQRQSLLLARTILRDPPVVLLDEPTASMDQQSETAFIQALLSWGAQKTIVIATHRMPPLQICDRLLVIDDGRVVMDGPKQDVMSKLQAKPAEAS